MQVQCSTCGKSHYKRPRDLNKSKSGNVFCSISCRSKYIQIDKICSVCKTTFYGSNKKYCTRQCADNDKAGKVYRNSKQGSYLSTKNQRIQLALRDGPICQKCKLDCYDILSVHHIIEQCRGGSDELINLQLICPNCHFLEHHRGKRDSEFIEFLNLERIKNQED